MLRLPRVYRLAECLRVSGKHNDLEEVGHDTYHHTMFEMLGNWSFGDYFKKDAVDWAWELLTEVYHLPVDRLYATVFEGAPDEGVDMDREAYDYWKKQLPENHIILGNKHDNFWEMGETGPCGPCSEIHFDLRDESDRQKVDGRDMVNQGHPLVIEIWNLVFMQFNRKVGGRLEPLPHRHIDTGMCFERLCMVLQGKKSNYDTDVFSLLYRRLPPFRGTPTATPKDRRSYARYCRPPACNLFLDCRRPAAFQRQGRLCDSSNPASCSALRLYLPRFSEPFICKLVPTLVGQMASSSPS